MRVDNLLAELVELRLEVQELRIRVAELEGAQERELHVGDWVKIIGKGKYCGRKAKVLGCHGNSRYYWEVKVKKLRCETRAPRVYRGRTSLEIMDIPP